MTDEFYMRRAIELAKKDVDGQIKPDGWCRDRRTEALSGKDILKNVVSFMQNGTQSHPDRKRRGSNTLCDAGAVLPLWEKKHHHVREGDSGTERSHGL